MACFEMTAEIATVEESQGAINAWEWTLVDGEVTASVLGAFPLCIK
jgi:hypothetical protein